MTVILNDIMNMMVLFDEVAFFTQNSFTRKNHLGGTGNPSLQEKFESVSLEQLDL